MPDYASWEDVSKKLPADLSGQAYDSVRKQYFDLAIRPRVKAGYDPDATWEAFKKATDRPLEMGRGKAMVGQFGAGLGNEVMKLVNNPVTRRIPVLGDLTQGAAHNIKQAGEHYAKTAEYQGQGHEPEAAGALVGQAATFGSIAAGAGALAEGLDLGGIAAKLFRGSLAFSTFEAIHAKNGQQFTAGVKGAVEGAAFEAGFSLLGKLYHAGVKPEDAEKVVTDALVGKPVKPEIDQVVTQSIKDAAEGSKKEMRPLTIKEDPSVRGVRVYVQDKSGSLLSLDVKPEAEGDAVQKIKSHVDNGGQVVFISHNPNERGLLNRFLKMSADMNSERYENVRRVKVEPGKAKQVADELALNGQKVEAVNDDTIHVQGNEAVRPTSSQIASRVGSMKDEEGYPLSKGAQGRIARQVEALWDPKVSDERKAWVADQLKNHDLADILPSQWRVSKLDEIAGEIGVAPEERQRLDQLTEEMKAEGLTEAEIARLEEITDKAKSVRVESPGVVEEMARKGEIESPEPKSAPKAALAIPFSEQHSVEYGADGPRIASTSGEHYNLRYPSKESFEGIMGESEAITFPVGSDFAKGFAEMFGEEKPVVAYHPQTRVQTIYHENLHVKLDNNPIARQILLDHFGKTGAEDWSTSTRIALSLKKAYSAYAKSKLPDLLEEAYVHAATALRYGDERALGLLAQMDTSVEAVTRMVRNATGMMYGTVEEGVDTIPNRLLKYKFDDLLRRTSNARSWELRNAAKLYAGDVHFDPNRGVWSYVTRDGEQWHIKGGYEEIANWLDTEARGALHAPSLTTPLELRGVRGPITPRGAEPDGRTPMPSPDIKYGGWVGWKGLTGLFRPFFPWAADVDANLARDLQPKGIHFPLYNTIRDVDDAFRGSTDWRVKQWQGLVKALEGVDSKRSYDYFNVLTDANWRTNWDKFWSPNLGLTDADKPRLEAWSEWADKFRDETGVNLWNYIRDEFPKLRGFGYDTERVYGKAPVSGGSMSTFHRLITDGELDPRDAHLGRFSDVVMREGIEKKFMREPLGRLDKLLNQKYQGKRIVPAALRWPLENYYRYMKGIPDASTQILKAGLGSFTSALGKAAERINRFLPAEHQLPTEFQYPGSVLNKLMVWSYAGALGMRAAIPLRDSLQVFSTVLPVLGPERFAAALAKVGDKAAFEFALESGALLRGANIGDLYGDILHEASPGAMTGVSGKITDISNKLLAPSRWGHNVARFVAFTGEYDSALAGVRKLRAGEITADEFIQNPHTSLWFNDESNTKRLLKYALDPHYDPQEAAKKIALETVDLTLWPYRRGAQPSLLRTGAGRVFGQFGMWPMNYADFLQRSASKYARFPKQAAQMTALWSAANFAAVSSMEAFGADTSKWFWISPAGYGGGPHAAFVANLFKSPEETPEGRQARKDVLEYPLTFLPSGMELENIFKVMESNQPPFDENGHPTPALIQLLGFKPTKATKEQEFDQFLREEMGYAGGNRNR